MAEHFYGRDGSVHFTNGGGDLLLQAWIKAGEQLTPTPALSAVLEFLRDRLRHGAGLRSFTIDPPPAEIAEPERLRCFAEMVEGFANELIHSQTHPDLDIEFDRGLELSWLDRVFTIRRFIGDALGENADQTVHRFMQGLSTQDRLRCDYLRLTRQFSDLHYRVEQRKVERDPQVFLALVNEILLTMAGQQPSPNRDVRIVEFLILRSDLMIECGDKEGGLAAMQEAIAAERDPGGKQILRNYAATINVSD